MPSVRVLNNCATGTGATGATGATGPAGPTGATGATGASGGAGFLWWFGSGEDGTATLDGSATVGWASKSGSVYTMTRSVVMATLTINSGVTLITVGYAIYASVAIINNGTIHNNGGPGITNTTGAGAVGNCFGGGTSGGSGPANSVHSLGGSAGAGGSSSTAPSLGTNPAVLPTEVEGGRACIGSLTCTYTGRTLNSSNVIQGGAGGWIGAGTVGDPNSGGSGGGGGGVVAIFTRTMSGTGLVQGNGGAAAGGQLANCGGGGGGGGGVIFLISETPNPATVWTMTVGGGLGGLGNGSHTFDGAVGIDGRIITWTV